MVHKNIVSLYNWHQWIQGQEKSDGRSCTRYYTNENLDLPIVSGWCLYWTVFDFLSPFGCDQNQYLKNESVNMVMQIKQQFIMLMDAYRWQCGWAVSVSDLYNDCFFVWVPLCPLNYLFLSCPEFKASPTLVNRQLITSCQLGFLNLVVFYYFGSCVFIVCVRYGMPSTLTSASINKPFFLKLIFSLE